MTFHCSRKRGPFILLLLPVVECMFSPLTSCWDEFLIPKWYATMATVIIGGIIYLVCRKSIREVTLSEWIASMADAATVGILYQGGYALVKGQLLHPLSSNGVTGTFDLPAGLALTVCLLLPFIFWQCRSGQKRGRYVIALCTGVALVMLSLSRTGMVALCVEAVILLLSSRIKVWIKAMVILAISVGTCGAVLFTKQDSSSGRTFIMEQTVRLIQEKPLWGHGFHGFSREYMTRQQQYFQEYPDTDTARLADEIKHPLNEFLHAWVNYGVLGAMILLLCILVPIIAYHRHLLAWMSMGTLFIFCTLSYPLNYPIAWIYLIGGVAIALHKWFPFNVRRVAIGTVAILALGIVIALPCDIMLSRAHNFSQRGGHSRAIATYKECEKLFHTFPFSMAYPFRCRQFLYNYTYELYSMGHLDEATRISKECKQCANGYNLQLLTGDIHQKQKDYAKAITHYQHAHHMCPVRFAPLSGLLQTYQQMGDTMKADSIAQAILNKPIKIPSSDINEMRAEAEKWLRK